MSDAPNDPKSPKPAHVRAQEHLKKILLTGAALTLGSACESCQPMVCDPLPPPICDKSPTTQDFMNQGKVQTTAAWNLADAGGDLYVQVELTLYGEGEAITFAADPGLTGARLLTAKRDGAKVSFSFIPNAGVSKVEAVLQVDCATRPEALKLGFDVTSATSGKQVAASSLE